MPNNFSLDAVERPPSLLQPETSHSLAKIRCREIDVVDISAAVRILKEGFPNHEADYWAQMFTRLTNHRSPPGLPKYGYLLQADDQPVGVILTIFSQIPNGAETYVRCNVASWYVQPQFRSHGLILHLRANAHRGVTCLVLTPAPNVVRIIEAQGYRQYTQGMFACTAFLCFPVRGAVVRAITEGLSAGDDLSQQECDLLVEHRGYGCVSVTCTVNGHRHPFVFARRWRRSRFGFSWLPYALLVYCRGIDEFARFAGPLGRFLALRGMPFVFLDANSPVPGVPGLFLKEIPKFFKGPQAPRLGDIAYSELAMFDDR